MVMEYLQWQPGLMLNEEKINQLIASMQMTKKILRIVIWSLVGIEILLLLVGGVFGIWLIIIGIMPLIPLAITESELKKIEDKLHQRQFTWCVGKFEWHGRHRCVVSGIRCSLFRAPGNRGAFPYSNINGKDTLIIHLDEGVSGYGEYIGLLPD